MTWKEQIVSAVSGIVDGRVFSGPVADNTPTPLISFRLAGGDEMERDIELICAADDADTAAALGALAQSGVESLDAVLISASENYLEGFCRVDQIYKAWF